MFDRLFNAITDIEMNLSLGIENLLIKDFKTYFIINDGKQGVGLGTITVPLQLLVSSFTIPKMKEAMKRLMDERGLSFYGILTNYLDKSSGEYKKEILLFSDQRHQSHDNFDNFVQCMGANEGYQLRNQTNLIENDDKIVHWEVGNTKYSRKDFEKVMTQFYLEV